MEFEGLDVVKYLNGHNSVRDGALVGFSIQQIITEPVIELVFEVSRAGGVHTVKLELRDIQEFQYDYSKEDPQYVIEALKCIMTDTGDFFLSLDPYDEHEAFISDKDGDFFRSKFVKLTTQDSAT